MNSDDDDEENLFLAAFGDPNVDSPMPPLRLPKEKNDYITDTTITHYRMAAKHLSLSDLWDEWHGLGKWDGDQHGGIKGRNDKHGTKWRTANGFSHQHYSRSKRIIDAIEKESARQNAPISTVIEEFESAFNECNCSTANFVGYLQQSGVIAVRKSRGKTKKQWLN